MRGTDRVGLCISKLGLLVDKPGLSMAVITFLDKPAISKHKTHFIGSPHFPADSIIYAVFD